MQLMLWRSNDFFHEHSNRGHSMSFESNTGCAEKSTFASVYHICTVATVHVLSGLRKYLFECCRDEHVEARLLEKQTNN